MMSDWPTDHELLDAESRLRAKFAEYYTTPVHRNVGIAPEFELTAVPGLTTCMSLDPRAISEDFSAMQRAARDIADSERADVIFATISDNRLAGWKGEAAQAFVARMTAIKGFASEQGNHILRNLNRRAAIYQIAVTTRKSYLELMETTIAAIDVEMGNQAAREAKAWANFGLDLAKDLASLDPRKLLSGAIGTMIGVIKNTIELLPDGSGMERIASGFTEHARKLAERMDADLIEVRTSVNDDIHLIANQTAASLLVRPMPTCLDVDSPDFRYSSFWFVGREPEVFEPSVQAEREKMQQEEERRQNDIYRRLGGTA
ncbi:hypothetical protein [Actinokineospora sp. NPDC004072]